MFGRNKMIKDAKKMTGVGEGGDAVVDLKKLQAKELQNFGDLVGEEGSGKGKGKGRGRRKKRNIDEVDGDGNAVEAAALPSLTGAAGIGDDLGDVDADLDDLDEDEPERHRDKRAKSNLGS